MGSALPNRPEDWPAVFVERLNAGDLLGVLELYAKDARFVTPTGATLVGRAAIRDVLAELIASRARLACEVVRATTAGDVAILYSDFTGERGEAGQLTPMSSHAIEVLRRQPNGGWQLIVGDPNGRERNE
jgi:uncharacterized protein (TIGR02246 family)